MDHGKNDLGSRWRREQVTPILATKLYIPPLRPHVVSRPRLLERLNEGLHRKLILISAPAGYGKTTLLSAWVAFIERPTAWLSLDDQDNDPTRFLTYLVAALQTIAATLGEGVSGVLQYGSNKTNQVTRAMIWWKSRSSSKGGTCQCSGFLRT